MVVFHQIFRRAFCYKNGAFKRDSLFGPTRLASNQSTENFASYSVKDLLDKPVEADGLPASTRGWISAIRLQKENTFIDIVDGSSFRHLQVVFKTDSIDPDSIVYGSAVEVSGNLRPSQHPMQKVELIGQNVSVIGTNIPAQFPIKSKVQKTHDGDYLRNEALTHRHRTHAGGSMLKIRNSATMAYHDFFQRRGFLLVNTPILTSNDCEGAGEVFRVVAKGDDVPDEEGKVESYFKRDVHLTVSGQLHLEAFAQGLSNVYTFGPTFRADSTTSRFHLSEFYMVEAEMSFVNDVSVLCTFIEDLLKETSQNVLDSCGEDLELYHKYLAKPKRKEYLQTLLDSDFAKMSYEEAVTMLKRKKMFEGVTWGDDLTKEMEKYLVGKTGNRPLFVHDYPSDLKPFYAKGNCGSKTCASFDLLLPEVGEVCGGTLREHDYDKLMINIRNKEMENFDEKEIDEKTRWYTDLRLYGSVPHGGFGIGFERHLMFLTGVGNIRNCIPIPRSKGKCLM